MHIAVEDLPILFLIIMGIGMIIVIISIILLAGLHDAKSDYYVKEAIEEHQSNHMQELFSYFLEEEEKKNNQFRALVLENAHEKTNPNSESKIVLDAPNQSEMVAHSQEKELFDAIISRYKQGEDPESIAKSLKKGIGEVKLIISLYAMR